jgi:RimJ/RimL family protein N-acetyltransferase
MNSWEAIGSVGLANIDLVQRNAELFVFIGEKDSRNKGAALQAIRLMAAHGFNNFNLHRVWVRVFAFNVAGQHLFQKCGFAIEGRLREAKCLDGKYHDVIFMGMLEHELHENHRAS